MGRGCGKREVEDARVRTMISNGEGEVSSAMGTRFPKSPPAPMRGMRLRGPDMVVAAAKYPPVRAGRETRLVRDRWDNAGCWLCFLKPRLLDRRAVLCVVVSLLKRPLGGG